MKPNPRRIVCATDFSPNTRGAADVARAIALRLNATLVLAHVADPFGAVDVETKEFRLAMSQVKKQLQGEARRLRQGGAQVETVLMHGRAPEALIAEFLAKTSPLLVVVASVSKTLFDRWTLGSVSEHVAQHSPVPTLVVRSPDRLRAWAEQNARLNILVAVDFTLSSDAALAFVRELRKVGPCAVTVGHIHWPPQEGRWLAPGVGLPLTTLPEDVRRRLLRDLRKKAGAVVDGEIEVRLEPNWGRPDAALVHLAMEAQADLILVGTHQRQGVQRLAQSSFSRGVLRHAPMSVVCVPLPSSSAELRGVAARPRVQRILVGTDLSSTGDQAIPWAYATVEPGGTVQLVHVVEPWKVPSPLVPRYSRKSSTPRENQRRIEEARRKLASLVPAEAVEAGIQTEIEIVEDADVAHGLGMAVRQFGPDVICLAARRRRSLSEAVLGSVARSVMVQNSQPVLWVCPGEQ